MLGFYSTSANIELKEVGFVGPFLGRDVKGVRQSVGMLEGIGNQDQTVVLSRVCCSRLYSVLLRIVVSEELGRWVGERCPAVQ